MLDYKKYILRLIIYDEMFTGMHFLLAVHVNSMFICLMDHSDGLSLLFSAPPGPMYSKSIRLGK